MRSQNLACKFFAPCLQDHHEDVKSMVEGLEFGSPKVTVLIASNASILYIALTSTSVHPRQRVEKSGRKTETTLYGCQEPVECRRDGLIFGANVGNP